MNERKKSGACVADPFDRAKGSLKRLDTFAIPRRVQAAGRIYLTDICADAPRFVNAGLPEQLPLGESECSIKKAAGKTPSGRPGKNGLFENLPPRCP
jgi:hypothetical protein